MLDFLETLKKNKFKLIALAAAIILAIFYLMPRKDIIANGYLDTDMSEDED